MEHKNDLSPEHVATLLDLAQKLEARNARQAVSGAVVKRHDWTKEERKLHAAKNDLRSAQFVYERTRVAKEAAEKAFEVAELGLVKAQDNIKLAIAAAKDITEE